MSQERRVTPAEREFIRPLTKPQKRAWLRERGWAGTDQDWRHPTMTQMLRGEREEYDENARPNGDVNSYTLAAAMITAVIEARKH